MTHRRCPLAVFAWLLLPAVLAGQTGNITWDKPVPRDFEEPAWLDEGLVFVGNWEPLNFRLRKGGDLTIDAAEVYRREHLPETVLALKRAGVNFILTHFYKTGLAADRQSMDDAKAFVALCHEHGIRVGAYIGGTMFTETVLRDTPEAEAWIRRDEYGVPIRYGHQPWRVLPDFNHPGYVNYIKQAVRRAVEAGFDLLHFDNFSLRHPPDTGCTPEINRRFRAFLEAKYTFAEREQRFGYGFADLRAMTVPTWHGIASPSALTPIDDPKIQEWIDFRCADLADYYGKLADYARSLNPNIVVELNPHGIFGRNRAFHNGIHHARLLPHGSVFWSEEPNEAGLDPQGRLVSKIRSYKLARSLGQTMFSYTGMQRANLETRSYRLLMAESMAFNRNSLGDLGEPLDYAKWPDDFMAYVRFYRTNNEHYRAMRPVADVAILRSFPSMAYNSLEPYIHTTLLEQLLIQGRIPFGIVFDHDLADLSKYDALLLGGQECLSDRAVSQIREYVSSGGGLVATGSSSLYNEWRRRRPDIALADVLGVSLRDDPDGVQPHRQAFGRGRAVYVPEVVPASPFTSADLRRIAASGIGNDYWDLPANADQLVAAIRHAAGGSFSVEFRDTPPTTVMEYLEKNDGSERVLHCVNYDLTHSVSGAEVSLRVPADRSITTVTWLSPDQSGSPRALKFRLNDGRVQFSLPELEVYGIAVIKLAPSHVKEGSVAAVMETP